ncbi:DUF2064 domain-containing protein [Algibacter sp. L1A34]|uniref:TIGR04282 family arsenosugar biosynthesis glycosyltransferase n=1 Tax=Algibacter sp. L1A34 TaxID=2686365 RepID=UPI00131D8AD4|nr:DUF2064 domain-containing protein [Algibacter sp. L1A34]
MKKNKIAILIFANSAEKEMVSKPLPSPSSLFEALNLQTINIAKKTGLPYFHLSENQQIGVNFGERFTNAIQSVYNKGYDTVITIGNDTPHLTAKHILKTAEKLKHHHVVLGPSTDGGFYLMGLKKDLFNPDVFLKLPWQTTNLNRNISKVLASETTQIHYLEVLTDIDNASDIERVLNSFKSISAAIKSILLQSISISTKIIAYHITAFHNFVLKRQHNKGSPALLHLQ